MNFRNISGFAADLTKLLEEHEIEADEFIVKLFITFDDYEDIRERFRDFERHPPQDLSGGSMWIEHDQWRIEIYGGPNPQGYYLLNDFRQNE